MKPLFYLQNTGGFMINSSQLSFGFEVPTVEKSLNPIPVFSPVKFKTCLKCSVHKPVSEFYKATDRNGGFHVYCKPCSKAYNAKATEIYRIKRKAEYKVNPWPRRLGSLNQRAKRFGAIGVITYNDLQEVLALYSNKCAYCFMSLENGLWFDHIWPLSLIKTKSLGWEFATNTVENLIPACEMCNRAKADKSMIIFLAWKNGMLD
jgi:5-methylcytosine-specific restriction endonuclease McrA